MQRISLKHLVFLVLLVMSISLLPSAIVLSASEDGSGATQRDPSFVGPVMRDVGGKPENAEAKDGQKESSLQDELKAPVTLERLQNELDLITTQLEIKTKTPKLFNIRLDLMASATAITALLLAIILLWQLSVESGEIRKKISRLEKSHAQPSKDVYVNANPIFTDLEKAKINQFEREIFNLQRSQKLIQENLLERSERKSSLDLISSSPAIKVDTNIQSTVPNKPSIRDLIAELVLATNSGDRHKLRAATTAELNFTDDSVNSIQMGFSEPIELEEVLVGGSYLLITLEGKNILFPTEKTLLTHSTSLTLKTLFTYKPGSVSKAEIIEPALLEKSGAVWRVVQKGRVAIP